VTVHIGAREPGTYSAYFVDKCRCEPCATRQRDRVRANRAARLARVETLTHSLRSTYDAGCRCTKCRQARKDACALDRASYSRRALAQRVPEGDAEAKPRTTRQVLARPKDQEAS